MKLERLKPLYPARLPAVAVTPELLERVKAAAKQNDMSVGEIIRQAVSFFLSTNTSKSGETDIKTDGQARA